MDVNGGGGGESIVGHKRESRGTGKTAIGQEHDVTLTNLVCRGTIEQRVMHVLEAKINLFELVVGELDMILGRVDDDFDFENEVFDAFVDAVDDDEFERRLDALGNALAEARRNYLRSREGCDLLVGEPS